ALLAAVAAAKTLGVPDNLLLAGLRSLDGDTLSRPLPLKVVDDAKRRLIVGLCYDAIEAANLARAAKRLSVPGERMLCLGFATDPDRINLLAAHKAVAAGFERCHLAASLPAINGAEKAAVALRAEIETESLPATVRARTRVFCDLAAAIDDALDALPLE